MAFNTPAGLDELKHLIRTLPVIDNHAHNLLREQNVKRDDFLAITSEATGVALEDATQSLPHLRAQKQLRGLYELPPTADWDSLMRRRAELNQQHQEDLIRRCLAGTHTILVDDGLGNPADLHNYSWHNTFTSTPCKRILRIETVATDVLFSLHQQGRLPIGLSAADEEASALAWVTFITAFEQAITIAIQDSEIAGFKSVVCYRTGLDIRVGKDIQVTEDGLRSFRKNFLPGCEERQFRVECKGMNDALVISTCKLVAAGHKTGGTAKPIQFHTGLGDNDIDLLDANPACLQELIKAFPTVPVVLLHSSYPYTREAGYLATVYKNVYLDIGEVFPMVSRQGQIKILEQALELTPTNKILWSTDGHHYPETYYLANVQGRQALEEVFVKNVEQEDLTIDEATLAIKDILFENSNRLYNLDLTLPGVDEIAHRGPTSSVSLRPLRPSSSSFKYVIIQWLDYLATLRSRAMPFEEFQKMIWSAGKLTISYGNLGTLQNDGFTPACNPVGQIGVEADVSTLRSIYAGGGVKNTATVMARFTDLDGQPHVECPRSKLQQILATWSDQHQINFLVGFEIEATFCRYKDNSATNHSGRFEPLDTNHAWGSFTDEQYIAGFPLLFKVVDALKHIGITPQAVHTESGAGQYEIVLPPLPPVQAVDTLIQARQCIQHVAAANGLRATLHPSPFPGIGTAAHAHISLNHSAGSPHMELNGVEHSFLAAILQHLPSLCAMTLPNDVSYGRVADNHWTSGTWVAWGVQNREVPIRQSASNRWEVRCLDGMANMYIALYAILGAGLLGVQKNIDLEIKPCPVNPSTMTVEQLEQLGVTRKLPTSIEQALDALDKDNELLDFLDGHEGLLGILRRHSIMRRAEKEMLDQMEEAQRRVWLMERY